MGKKEGGRTINPADRLRKEQRAKEAKKNAERRAMTRAAIVGQKTEDELREQLATIKRAEAEGRADGKQAQLRKQIEERLKTLEKEEEDKPKPTLSLEEMYPDAEGSVYYHPTQNPYGVPPPGCFPMWKPGYVPKAQRHLLPPNHPLHPDFMKFMAKAPAAQASTSQVGPREPLPSAPSASSSYQMDFQMDEDDDFDDSELEGIPPPPEEPDSDGEETPPAPPTTEEDLPNIVYDEDELVEDENEGFYDFGADEREEEEMNAPPAKKRSFPGAHMPVPPPMPLIAPPPFMMMPFNPAAVPFPPPGPPPGNFPPRQNQRQPGNRREDRRAPRKEKITAAGEIPDPLDNGPYKKEREKMQNGQQKGDAAPATTSAAPTAAPGPQPAPKPAPIAVSDAAAASSLHLVPSQLRGKRKMPTEMQSRPVAPRIIQNAPPLAASSPSAPANSAPTPSSSAPDSSFDAFMSDMKSMGAIP